MLILNNKGKGSMRKLFTCLSLFALLTVFTVGQAAAFTIGNFVDDTAVGVFTVKGMQVNGTMGESANASTIAGFNGTLTLASNSSVIDQYGNFTSTGGFFVIPSNGTVAYQIDQSPGYTWFATNGSSLGSVGTDVNFKLQLNAGSPKLTTEFYGYTTSDNKVIVPSATGSNPATGGVFQTSAGDENHNGTAMLALVNTGSLTPATSLTAIQSGTWSFFTLAANASIENSANDLNVQTPVYAYRMGNLTVSSSNVASVYFWDSEDATGSVVGTLTASEDINGVTIQNASASNNLSAISYAGNWTIMGNATLDANSEVFIANDRFGAPSLTAAPNYANGTQLTVALKGAELIDADSDLQGKWKITSLGGQGIHSVDDLLIGNVYVDDLKDITDGAIFSVTEGAATNTAFTTSAKGSMTWQDRTINSDTFTEVVIKNNGGTILANATGRMLNSANKKLFVGVLFDAAAVSSGQPTGMLFMSGTASGAPKATIDATENNLTVQGFTVGLGANATLLGANYWNLTNPVTSDFFGFTGTPGADVRVLVTFNATIDDPTGLTVGGSSVNLFKVDNATSNRQGVKEFTYSTTLTDDVKVNSNASLTDSDVGTWCLFDPAAAAQFCEGTGTALEAGKTYTVAYVVKEGSSWDLYNGDAGVLVDPVFIAGAAGGSSSSDSGCVLNPAAGFGLEWLLLLAAPLLAVLRNRFRK